ncbi:MULTISPECIES: hypothetical protein [Pseudomonas]|jgi:hypothetical protein|uniref:Uncharacterized protein n=1 Tax=Pseudomonas granadensis TaxID=1421430 RepID=A0ABX7G969_9PSED|nr:MULTISPECIES: hypothetical protein [Pseudomonas]MBD8597668.1 hypothetical protein [Pseudomonas sp. CFBP 8772]MDF3189164.1 hypothetical protein [Pseudomonas paracarnis]QRK81893.1 hypothetical protein JN757_15045 [Pseudomonas granadensis]
MTRLQTASAGQGALETEGRAAALQGTDINRFQDTIEKVHEVELKSKQLKGIDTSPFISEVQQCVEVTAAARLPGS